MRLRPYQIDFFERVRLSRERGCNRQLGALATGLGKAVLYANLKPELGLNGKILVLVHREELAAQAKRQLEHWNPGLMVGVEMGLRHSAPMDDLVVGSVPTLGQRNGLRCSKFHLDEFSAVISDECHHLGKGSQWERVLEHFHLLRPGEGCLSLGLTATPNRSDGAPLRPYFDEIVFSMGLWQGIEQGYLVPLEPWRVHSNSNLDTVHAHGAKFNSRELSDAINTPERNASIVKEWTQRAWGKRTLAFCESIQHATDLAAMFRHFGISALPIWGTDPDRAEKFARHRSGEITVLTNCQLAREGYDDRNIECIILGTPHKAALPVEQEIGRGTRLEEGIDNLIESRKMGTAIRKPKCIVLSVTDLNTRHKLFDVPALFGLPEEMDLQGKSPMFVKEEVERIQKTYPMADLSHIKCLNDVYAASEKIDLFKVEYPPEIVKMTRLNWRKGSDGYFITVNGQLVTVNEDMRGDWQVRGKLGDNVAEFGAQNLPGALNAADKWVLDNGGCSNLLTRGMAWNGLAATDKQLRLARYLKIAVPNGATRGMVSAAIDAKKSLASRVKA